MGNFFDKMCLDGLHDMTKQHPKRQTPGWVQKGQSTGVKWVPVLEICGHR